MVPPSFQANGNRLVARYSESACAKLKVCLSPGAWNLPPTTYIPGIDIVILFDTTGSMNPYIAAMIANLQQLIDNLNTMTPSLRLGLASFKDFGDKSGQSSDLPFYFKVPLTTDVARVRTALGTLTASGGGDAPESLSTAIQAAVTGQALAPYYGASNMEWSTDPARIQIVLGITDASNRATNLPAGAANLAQAAQIMKDRGILFLGIGRGTPTAATAGGSSAREAASSAALSEGPILTISHPSTPSILRAGRDEAGRLGDDGVSAAAATSPVNYESYADLATLARATGALIQAPGVDLNGDGNTNTDGELKAGDPAVLRMTASGQLLGASASANPTRVLADAITAMVRRVSPFHFSLAVNPGDHSYSPNHNIVLAVPPGSTNQYCFTTITFNPLTPAVCPVASEVSVSAKEENTGTNVDARNFRADLEIDETCGTDPAPNPSPTATPTPTPTITFTPQPSPSPGQCTGFGCGGPVIGI